MMEYNRGRLFFASCLSLITAAFVFIIRGDVLDPLRTQFGVDSATIGGVAGLAFFGLAIAIFIGSPLCDWVGMGRLLGLACILHIVGITMTIFAASLSMLGVAMLIVGLAHGLVEGVINPLCATIYPEEKTHKLNVLHAWWPGGLVMGGLCAKGLEYFGASWQMKQGIILIPAIIYGVLIIGLKFPKTERVASGVSAGDMFKEALRPGFLLMAFCMLLTAATELGPGQWMESVLKETAKASGTLVLVYISGLMCVLRFFAGPIAHRISPIGILAGSSVLSAIGLFMLGGASNTGMAYVSATIFALGVCYYWPTMLGVVAERFPRGGAFLLGLMGTMGMISMQFVLPLMGKIRDQYGGAASFQYVAVVPVFLVIIFGAMFAYYKSIGGYKAVSITE